MRTVIVHDKVSHENVLVSFVIVEKILSPVTGSQTVSEVHSMISEIPVEQYVVVDIKTQEDFTKPTETTTTPVDTATSTSPTDPTSSPTESPTSLSPSDPTSPSTLPITDPVAIQRE